MGAAVLRAAPAGGIVGRASVFLRVSNLNLESALSSRAAALQALLAERFPDTLPAAQRRWSAVPTGVPELDRIFPSGGLQRGRITAWAPGIGGPALLRAALLHTVANGERAAWVDAPHIVAGACWRSGPVLLRPRGEREALRTAEVLTRSGGFALIVLDGVHPDPTAMVRLSRAAHEGGAALALITHVTSLATVRLTSRPLPAEYEWRRSTSGEGDDVRAVRILVEARASGWRARTELSIPVWQDDFRLSLEPGRADGRGFDARALAPELLASLRAAGAGDSRAGVASTPIAAEVGAVHGEDRITVVPPGE